MNLKPKEPEAITPYVYDIYKSIYNMVSKEPPEQRTIIRRAITRTDPNGEAIHFTSIEEAANDLIELNDELEYDNARMGINSVINGHYKTYKTYIWTIRKIYLDNIFIKVPKEVIDSDKLIEVSRCGLIRQNDEITAGSIDCYGYLSIGFNNKKWKVHRLVGLVFIDCPAILANIDFNKLEINHKNEVKWDNRVVNLEWMTKSDHTRHGHKNGLFDNHKKAVKQFSLDGKFIKEFESAREAENQTNITQGNISNCCNGIRKTAGNYIWEFSN